MGKTKKDTNARVAGQRKQTRKHGRANVFGQLCMDYTSNGLSESDDSSISDSSEESLSTSLLLLSSSKIFTEPFFSLTAIFFHALYDSYSFIHVANFRFFIHCSIFICSSLSSTFSRWFMFLTWSMFTYNLIE